MTLREGRGTRASAVVAAGEMGPESGAKAALNSVKVYRTRLWFYRYPHDHLLQVQVGICPRITLKFVIRKLGYRGSRT